MKHTFIRLFAGALALCLLVGAAGCKKEPEESSAPPTTTTKPTTTTTAAPEEKLPLNPFTGKNDIETANNRPIGFMVTDETATLTQLNLEHADMYIEAETEAGIPRVLALFSSIDRIPDVIGPIRSARPHFVKLAKALDAIYCHIGGSRSGLEMIKELGVNDMAAAYEINEILKNSANFSWNRSAFTKEKVLAQVGNIPTTTDKTYSLFTFGAKEGSMPAATVNVQLSESYHMAFTYNEETGLYEKHRNSLSSPVHVTYTGGTVTASNIIVMYAKRIPDRYDSYRYDFELTEGTGVLACGKTARNITWKMTDNGLFFYEEDGKTTLSVAEGKTYVCLTNSALASKTVIS
ncbi:MAG: DUF3048 domain-containing protein [Clostridia bacterium]|nr:DUF3048 domain-containing protein [Clostridia bacterium]